MLRRLALAGALAIAVLGFGLVHAGSASAATYTVCGIGEVVPVPGGGNCMTLSAAITAAQATPEADTIRMLPGTYCPFDLEGSFAQPIRFIGVGLAGLSGTVGLSGPEAALTTVSNDGTLCGSNISLINVNANVSSGAPMIFQNITVDGSSGGEFGFHQQGVAANTILRDDIFENVGGSFGEGIFFQSGFQFGEDTSLEIDNSAIIDNHFGVVLSGATASMYDSTVAGNTGVGLSLGSSEIASFGSDTISHNGTGMSSSDGGFGIQVVNTIVDGNTQDCGQTGDWEQGNGVEGSSFNNLFGSSCPLRGAHDIEDSSPSIPAVALNGGPTPTISAPLAGQGHGQPTCGLGAVDQREFTTSGSCDIGAMQTNGSSVGSVSASDIDVGNLSIGSTSGGTVDVGPSGAGLVGVSGVSISGAGWSVTSDQCTYMIMESSFFAPIKNCSVSVSVHPTSIGTWNGTLTVHTTSGDATAHLHAQVVALPTISSFGPTNGPVGTSVVITGANFTGTTNVAFGGRDAQSFHVDSDSQITAVVAAGTQTGAVAVTNSAGTATSTRTFVVTAALPTIRLFNPGQGSAGDTVTILGSNLAGASAVTFGGVPAVSYSAAAGSITVTVPVGGATGHIVVTTPGGTATSIGVFTVIPAVAPTPTITSFNPGGGIHGVHVTIHGTGFTGATQVTFNGKAAVFTVVNDSTIIAIVPTGATTGSIKVTTPGGTATSATNFSI